MGILDDIESGLGLAPAPMAADVPAALLEDPLYSGAGGVDAAMPMGSADQAAAQTLAQTYNTTPATSVHATVPGWTTLHIQQDLNALGASPQLAEDGAPGPKTTAAIVAFQQAHGLPQTGVVDAATQNAMVLAMGIQVDVPSAAPPAPVVAPAAAPAAVDPLLGGKPPAPAPAAAAKKPLNVKAVVGVGIGAAAALALAVKAHVFGR